MARLGTAVNIAAASTVPHKKVVLMEPPPIGELARHIEAGRRLVKHNHVESAVAVATWSGCR